MALEEDDKAEIAAMIAEATKSNKTPTRTARPTGPESVAQSDWDRMSERDRQNYVRSMVEEANASLDAEYERENLKEENKALKAQIAEWEKGGRKGARPTKASDDKRTEEPPTVVGKAFKWLFGEVPAGKS